MKDFNFLIDEDSVKKNLKEGQIFLWIGLVSISLVFMSGLWLYRWGQIKKIQTAIATISEELTANTMIEKIEKIEKQKQGIQELEQQLRGIKNIGEHLQQEDPNLFQLFYEIGNQVPQGIFLESLEMDAQIIRLQGCGIEEKRIALFKQQLEEIEKIEKIYIPQVSKQDNQYSFTMNIQCKGGEINETE